MGRVRLVAPLALAVIAGCGGDASSHRLLAPISDVHFDEVGGEIWAFERRVSGRAPPGCVTVEIKRGPVHLRVPVRGGRFSGVVPLAPGENVIGAHCADPPFSSRDARLIHRVRLPAGPTARARLVLEADAIAIEAIARENAATHVPIAGYRWSADPTNPAPLITREGRSLERARRRRVELSIPEADGEYVVWLEVHDRARRRDRAGVAFSVEGGRVRALDRSRHPPAWLERAFFYGSVGTRLSDERLVELVELGINALWVRDAQEEEIRAFVERAHRHGIRVLLEVDPGRTGLEHPYSRHLARHPRRSPYRALYEADGSGRLDLDQPAARRFVLESLASLVRQLGVDGFRVRDASVLATRAPRFLHDMREELTRIDPRVVMVAEGPAVPIGFDAIDEPSGPSSFRHVFAQGDVDVASLERALSAAVGARLVRSLELRSPLERVSTSLLFTSPGIPSLRSTDELDGARLAELRTLARLRADEGALRRGRFVPLSVEPAGVYGFARLAEGARPIVIVLGLASGVRTARVRLPPELAGARRVVPLFGQGARVRLGRGVLVVSLGPHDARVFALE